MLRNVNPIYFSVIVYLYTDSFIKERGGLPNNA